MNDATLNVVLVTSRARKPPKVDNSADARIAVGAEKVRNSNSSTTNNSSSARNNTMDKS